ncbi:MAG: cobalamin biosynthesis protein, partial [Gemmobacter sp.]|nr:cobalamin biosynthesis protein [Gemmobacter sp.]
MSATLLIPALLLDAALGEPKWLWDRWPHPAVMIGRVISALDASLNKGESRRAKGVLAVGILVLGAAGTGYLIAAIPDFGILEVI